MKRRIFFAIIPCLILLFSSGVFSARVGSVILYKKDIFRGIEIKVKEAGNEFPGDFACIVKDCVFPYLEFSIAETEQFPAASVIKVPLLAVALQAVYEGKHSLGEEIIFERKDITGGSGTIKNMKLPVKLTFEEVLRLMITTSDNTAANKIIDILGYNYINANFKNFGLEKTVLERKMMDFSLRKKGVENYTTIYDLAVIFEKCYKKELINSEYSQLVLSFLKDQKVNDRIPRDLPKDVEIAHKTGLERGVVHDIGIVFTTQGDYIIGVLTKGVKDYQVAKKFIAKLSRETYNLYQKK